LAGKTKKRQTDIEPNLICNKPIPRALDVMPNYFLSLLLIWLNEHIRNIFRSCSLWSNPRL